MSTRNNPDSEQNGQDRRKLREQQQCEATLRDQSRQLSGDGDEADSPVIITCGG